MNHIEFGVNIARRSGEMIVNNFNTQTDTSWKRDYSPVTSVDRQVSEYVSSNIRDQFPGYSILGEEETYIGDTEYTWVVDPLDGTIPFMHGWPTFVFSLALLRNHEVILGIIYDPVLKRLVSAEKGQGTLVNGQATRVSAEEKLTYKSVINGGFQKDLSKARDILLRKNCKIINVYSPQYAGMLVALGKITAQVFAFSTPWDGASTKIIVEEAGGRVTDLNGTDQVYDREINGLVATNGKIHDELVEVLKRAR